jgi:CTP:molybdopterin cytidylyltransferase MocA
MGRPKLVLDLGGEPVIGRVVRALSRGGADPVLVVAPPVPEPAALPLAALARAAGAWVVHCPAPTADMRATVCVGLDAIARRDPAPDGLLLAPGDSPGLTPRLVARVIERFRADPGRIVVPVHAGKRGHPLALPWSIAGQIPALPEGTGINALLELHADRLLTVEVDEAGAIADMDTPDDYRRWARGGVDGP